MIFSANHFADTTRSSATTEIAQDMWNDHSSHSRSSVVV